MDWKLFGRPPPMDEAAWVVEFEKYKESPEFKYKNSDISMTEFKFIWWMEYGHRMWGRTIGGFFYIPAGTHCLNFWHFGIFHQFLSY